MGVGGFKRTSGKLAVLQPLGTRWGGGGGGGEATKRLLQIKAPLKVFD